MGEKAYGVQLPLKMDGAILRRWVETDGECGDLDREGAQSGEDREAFRRFHEPRMQAWLERFLGHRLEAPDGAAWEASE